MSADLQQLKAKLAELRYERDTIANTRTREDLRRLTESWLATVLSRANGSAAGFIPNQYAGPEQVQAVLTEYLLEAPGLVDFLAAKLEGQATLTDRQRASKLKALDAEIAKAEAQRRDAAKAAALAELEAQFAGEAA